ncbi:MAG: hypothetical protein ABIK08_04510 [Pseudomonadota bacterium]
MRKTTQPTLIDLCEKTGLGTGNLPKDAHDGEGYTPQNSFAALADEPGETTVNPADFFVGSQKSLAKELHCTDRTVRRQLESGSLSWIVKHGRLLIARVSSVAAHRVILGDIDIAQSNAALAKANAARLAKKTKLFPVTGRPKDGSEAPEDGLSGPVMTKAGETYPGK